VSLEEVKGCGETSCENGLFIFPMRAKGAIVHPRHHPSKRGTGKADNISRFDVDVDVVRVLEAIIVGDLYRRRREPRPQPQKSSERVVVVLVVVVVNVVERFLPWLHARAFEASSSSHLGRPRSRTSRRRSPRALFSLTTPSTPGKTLTRRPEEVGDSPP